MKKIALEDEFAFVEAIRRGDSAAIRRFVADFYPRIYRIVFQRLGANPGNVENAQDLSGEILWDCIVKIQNGGYDPQKGRLIPYIYGIINNSCKNFFKAKKRRRYSSFSDHTLPGSSSSGQEKIEEHISILHYQKEQEIKRSKEVAAAVEQALGELDEKYRRLIYLKYYQNLSYEEIARLENLTVKRVKSRLFDARRKLEKILPQKLSITPNFLS